MSESEPPMTYRKSQVLSKPETPIFSGISLPGVWLLRGRQPVYRRHDLSSGFADSADLLSCEAALCESTWEAKREPLPADPPTLNEAREYAFGLLRGMD
jgi:hypothetical protein